MMVQSQSMQLMCGALIVFIILPLVICQKCPKECECRLIRGLRRAVCNVDNINSVSAIDLQPDVIGRLHLKCNKSNLNPSSLKAQMFQKFYRLKELTLVNCSFDCIDKEAFKGLNFLQNLIIYNPVNFTLPKDVFRSIRNLKNLIISGSDWHELSFENLCVMKDIRLLVFMQSSITNILENSTFCSGNKYSFVQLEQLLLSYNEIQILRTGFADRFQNLKYLTFQRNNIKEIQKDSLVNLRHLKYLDVSHNYLQKLPDDFCAGCTELWELDISDNPIADIPASIGKMNNLTKFQAKNTLLRNISINLELSLISLNVINISLNAIPSPVCGNNSILEDLYLGGNQIVEIPANAFENCTSLEKLDLSDNNIESLSDESFNGLESLKVLSLSKNNISHIVNGTFSVLRKMSILDLSSNFLTKLPLFPYSTLQLNLTGNRLGFIIFGEIVYHSLQNLFLSKNQIQAIKNKTFLSSIHLRILHLNENGLKNIEEFAFTGLIQLSHLHLSYNYLEDFHSALKPLIRLSELQAEHNLLSTLKRNTFPGLLQKINLSKNKIKTIEEGTFENLEYLNMVDLRWNEIVSLDATSVKLNPNIIAVSNFSIFGNPLKCDCHLEFLKILQSINIQYLRI